MSAELLLAFSTLCLVYSVVLAHKSMRGGWVITPLLGFVATSVVFINIGFVVRFLGQPQEDWAQTALFCVSIGLLSVSLGGFFGSRLVGPEKGSSYGHLDTSDRSVRYKAAVTSSLVVFGVVLVYFYLLGYIPLYETISTSIKQGLTPGLLNTLRVQRDVYVNPDAGYIPLQGFMEIMRYFGLPVVTIWFVQFYKARVHPRLSLLMIALSVLLVISSGQRWPLMYMVTSFIVYSSWTNQDRQRYVDAAVRVLLVAFVAGTGLSILLGRAVSGDASIGDAILAGPFDLVQRVVLGNNGIPFVSYALFASDRELLLGGSWFQNLLTYLPGPMPSYPVTFYQLVTGSSIGFSAPPDFYTEAYINFKLPGVILVSGLWGLMLGYIHKWQVRVGESFLHQSTRAIMTTVLSFTAFSGAVMTIAGLIACVFMLVAARANTAMFSDREMIH